MSEQEKITLAKEATGAIPLRSSAPTKYEITMDTVDAYLAQYEKAMATNGVVTVEDGVGQQRGLLRMLKMVLRMEGSDFDNGWEELLRWVKKHNSETGVMGPRFRGRFIERATEMSSRDREILERLLHLLGATCDGASRAAALSRYDFRRVYKILPDTIQSQRIEGFYQQYKI
jgi:hypothetical protein